MNSEAKAAEPKRLPRRLARLLPAWWWALVALGVLACVIVSQVDRASSYILLFVTCFVGCLIVLIRHLRLGRGRLLVRAIPLFVFFGILGAATQVLRIDDVTGNLVPTRISFVWQPQRDELLNVPIETGEPVNIDLRSMTTDDFPQFLGPSRNGAIDGVTLGTDWIKQPPQLVWRKAEFGAGWSAFAAVNGYAVTQEQRGENEIVSCYEIATGILVWSNSTVTRHQTLPGGVGPRSTPTIVDGRVYTLGATGVLRCLDGSAGEEVWRRDLLAEIGTTEEEFTQLVAWGRAASPLVDAGRVVVPLGQSANGTDGASLAAFDVATGELLWKKGHRQISYASPMIATLDGVRQIVMVCEDAVCGHDAETGEPLWEYPWPGKSNANASCSQPVDAGNNRLFFSKGYAIGSALVEVHQDTAGEWIVQAIWRRRTTMKTKFTNVVIYNGYVYGLDDGILSCVDLETGQRKWKRGRYGHGQVLRVGDVLLVQAESGQVCLAGLNPERYEELARFSAIAGKTWNNPCLYGRYLLVRNSQEAACFELPRLDSIPLN